MSAVSLSRFIFSRLALVCIGLGFGLLVLELGFRVSAPIVRDENHRSDRPAFYYKHEAAKTLQDYPFSYSKPEGSYRLAVIGDSFTFGTSMQFDDAFPKKLERLFAASKTEPRVEVINYGIPGYSTDHEVSSAGQALRHGADFVLLQVTLNDAQRKLLAPHGITGTNRFGELIMSGVLRDVSSIWTSFGYVYKRVHNRRTRQNYIDYYFELFEDPVGWGIFRRAFTKIHRECRRNKVGFGVVILPLFGLPLDEDYPFLPLHQKIADYLEKREIPYVDLLSAFKNIPLERIQVEPGKDFHPNEIGHRIIAEQIFSWLTAEQASPGVLKVRADLRAKKKGWLGKKGASQRDKERIRKRKKFRKKLERMRVAASVDNKLRVGQE